MSSRRNIYCMKRNNISHKKKIIMKNTGTQQLANTQRNTTTALKALCLYIYQCKNPRRLKYIQRDKRTRNYNFNPTQTYCPQLSIISYLSNVHEMTDNLFKISTINSGCLYMGDVKRDFATHGYLSYLLRNSPVFMEKMIAGTFFDLFLSRDPSIKRDNFYHVNTPSHFAWTILF